MANLENPVFLYIFFGLLAVYVRCCIALDEDRKVYVVYMGALPEGQYLASSDHHNILHDVLGESYAADSLLYSYKRSFNGFAAKLTNEEQRRIANMDGVVSVFPSKTYKLHTTRSWDWMGFLNTVKRVPAVETDLIIGVLDTGISPDSESFGGEGFGPPPKKWKGVCQFTKNFTCNNKLIGARSYGFKGTPLDTVGHGSHTSSTVAGREVKGASLFGLAQGTARGAVPSARIAMYKVCDEHGCTDKEIMAAFDDAIADGVDLVSISLGSSSLVKYTEDPIAIGAFHAMKKGVLTVQSAGNEGSQYATTNTLAPWLLSVAASSTDRRIMNKLILGNGKHYYGNAVDTFKLNGTMFPLVSDADVPRCGVNNSGCLNEEVVRGKIIVYQTFNDGQKPLLSGALGMIATDISMSHEDYSASFPLPATLLSSLNSFHVISYMNSTKNPQANILKSESVFNPEAPTVVSFSSRGPNMLTSDILKPDISAPGVDILAAYSPVASVSSVAEDKRSTNYNILSGTSMACPHAAGAAAYARTFHPQWSPAAIKSALMTTAMEMKFSNDSSAEFSYGAGHIDPVKAVHPGLIYDATNDDYIQMLCSEGYDTRKVRLISGDKSSCPTVPHGSARDLNYPSMALKVEEGKPFTGKFSRIVTNVGLANSTYRARVFTLPKVKLTVSPHILSFNSLNEKQHFVVTVAGRVSNSSVPLSLSLVWSDGIHSVRSPIVVYTDSLTKST